jgi:hypothetical protein
LRGPAVRLEEELEMPSQFRVTTDPENTVGDFFNTLVADADSLEASDITFEAKAKSSRAFASGLPEISQLILALGSAHVFSALAYVLVKFFQNNRHGTIKLEATDGTGRTILFTAEDCSVDTVTKRLAPLLKTI